MTGGAEARARPPRASSESHLYLYGCGPKIERVSLTALRAGGRWDLEALGRPYVLWGPGVDGCPIGSPVFDGQSGRIFFSTPRNPSESADGHRPELIVGMQSSSFVMTDVIKGADWPMERAAMLVLPDRRLLVSQRRFDRQPGLGNGSVLSIDIRTPGKARFVARSDGVSFTEAAVFKDGTVWDENRAIRLTPNGPVQQTLDLDGLLGDARGAALLPYSAVDGTTGRRFVASQVYEASDNRALFSLPERGPRLSYAIGGIVPPSIKVVETDLAAGAVHLVRNGQRILAEEKTRTANGWQNTGRLVMTDADSAAVRADWRADRLQSAVARYLCAHEDFLLFGAGRTLFIVSEGRPNVAEVAIDTEVDRYTRCLSAEP
jgi:hypothetical protein